jgi:RNA polymerase primary sigma factor
MGLGRTPDGGRSAHRDPEAEKESMATAPEETAQAVDSFQVFVREIGHYSLLTREQEVALMQQVERGDRRAKERLVNSNLRLVVSIAKRYQGRGCRCPT